MRIVRRQDMSSTFVTPPVIRIGRIIVPSKHKRVRVERGLYKQGDVFYACVTAPGSRTATWKSLGALGIMEARRRRDTFAAEVQNTVPVLHRTRATLDEVAAEWLREQQLRLDVGEMSVRTFEIYEVGLRRHVLPALGRRQVRSITADESVRWIRQMRARYAPHTVHNYWGALHLVLGYAARRGLIAGNPAERLTSSERPKPGTSRRRFLSRDEMCGCSRAFRTDITPRSRVRCSPACGSLSCSAWYGVRGLRPRRASRLPPARSRWLAQAAQDAGRATRCRAHARACRGAAPSPPRVAVLTRPGPLVCSARGRTVGHRNLPARGLEKAGSHSGLSGVTFHVLRHTFASLLIDQGHDVVFVSRQLGHANPSITLKVYAHLFDHERHAEQARERLQTDYADLLRRGS